MQLSIFKSRSPSPQPSPLGRGNTLAQFLKFSAPDSIPPCDNHFANHGWINFTPLPEGEGRGEGEERLDD